MLTNYLFIILAFILMGAILTHPAVCVSGAATGLLTWFNSVVPSLFPFMVLTGLLTKSGALKTLSTKLKSLPLINCLPITELFAVVTGLLCGYPMGIRTVSDLKAEGQLNASQANLLYAFVNQPGPMFILGYALPLSGLSGRTRVIFLTAFYGGVCLTALTALLWMAVKKGMESTTANQSRNAPQNISDRIASQDTSAGFVLFEAILMTSMSTLAKIGGYMILFSLFAALLGELLPAYPFIRLFLCGLLEMTSGTAFAKDLGALTPYFVLGFISFGGISVAAQSFTLGNLSGKEQCRYLLWKAFQTLLSLSLFYILSHSWLPYQ